MRLSRIASLIGVLLLVFVAAGCSSTSTSTSSSPDESAVVGARAESFTKDFLEARVSNISSYFAENVELITIMADGTRTSEAYTRDALQADYTGYSTQVNTIRAAAPTLSLSATLSNKVVSMSGSTATVAGDIKVTATVGSKSNSVSIPGCTLTLTKAGDTWVITKWARPEVDPATFFAGLTG